MSERGVPRVMTVGGSDPGGGDEIQADLKTFAAFGVYGTSVITAVTAQTRAGAARVHEMPPDMVDAQLDAILGDIGADAVKTGFLATAEIVRAVASKISGANCKSVVVDPVMSGLAGQEGHDEELVESYRSELLPLALVATPSIPEAETLAGIRIRNPLGIRAAAKVIHGLGTRYVVVTGGHAEGSEATDIMFDGEQYWEFPSERIETRNTLGAGATFASAIASGLAHGRAVEEAVAIAKTYVTEALSHSFSMGQEDGTLNQLYAWWAAGGDRGYGG